MSETFPAYTFADPSGKRWSLEINYGKKNKIKTTLGVDLSNVIEQKLSPLAVLASDDAAFVGALWLLVDDQANAAGIEPEAFGASFTGDTFAAAWSAFMEAVVLFSHPHRRDAVRGAMNKSMELAAKVGSGVVASIDVDAEAKKLIDSFGSAQAS